jgi:hypothetical protein
MPYRRIGGLKDREEAVVRQATGASPHGREVDRREYADFVEH